MTEPTTPAQHPWRRYVAIGDSFTEGMVDVDPRHEGRFIGWADRLAAELAGRTGGEELHYANLAIRGRKLADVVGRQLDEALTMAPDLVSVVAGWLVIGLFYGFLRGEGTAWRSRPERLRAYQWATVVFAGMLALRLAVQLPLYAADLVGPLGAARIVMGTPFYLLVLWLGWLISRPATAPDRGPSDRGPEPA